MRSMTRSLERSLPGRARFTEFAVGFNSEAAFNRAFKRELSMRNRTHQVPLYMADERSTSSSASGGITSQRGLTRKTCATRSRQSGLFRMHAMRLCAAAKASRV